MRKFRQYLTEFSALDKIIAGYYCLTFLCRTMFQDFAQPDNGSKETRKIWMILCVQSDHLVLDKMGGGGRGEGGSFVC